MIRKRLLALVLALVLLCSGLVPALAEYNMPFYIEVDLTNQIVTIYNTKDNSIVRQMLTSSGVNDCTPEGTFNLTAKGRSSERTAWTYFEHYDCWVKYATRIWMGYMFHSLPYAQKDMDTLMQDAVAEFGMPASHGCMRLRPEDAYFIAKYCLEGTRVKIFKSQTKEEELRQLLYVSSYTQESGMSYAEFLGYSDSALGRDATGQQVRDLQLRLIDLGYSDKEPSGIYDVDTIAAVKRVQRDMGISESGVSTKEFLSVLFSDSAPISLGLVALKEGRSGPAVKRLQTALTELGFYEGEIDSIYDVDISQAVKLFQQVCGFEADGVASAEMQQALYYLLSEAEKLFGEDAIPAPELERESIWMGEFVSDHSISIREQNNTKSDRLGVLHNGDIVMINSTDGDWANITLGKVTGFVRKAYLEPQERVNYIARYEDASGVQWQIGKSIEEYKSGAKSLAAELASSNLKDYAADQILYASVNTGYDDVKLNLRAQQSTDSEVLAELPNDTKLRVLNKGDEWTQVGFGEQLGYLNNDYLVYHEGTLDELEPIDQQESVASQIDFEAKEDIRAVVVCTGEAGKAPVYEADSADAKLLGSLPAGTQLEVVRLGSSPDWVLIRLSGREGFMLEDNLQFQLL